MTKTTTTIVVVPIMKVSEACKHTAHEVDVIIMYVHTHSGDREIAHTHRIMGDRRRRRRDRVTGEELFLCWRKRL